MNKRSVRIATGQKLGNNIPVVRKSDYFDRFLQYDSALVRMIIFALQFSFLQEKTSGEKYVTAARLLIIHSLIYS